VDPAPETQADADGSEPTVATLQLVAGDSSGADAADVGSIGAAGKETRGSVCAMHAAADGRSRYRPYRTVVNITSK
jgi:hypothetical protein